MAVLRLTKKNIDEQCRLPAGTAQAVYWDAGMPGFGLVVGRLRKTYVLKRGGRQMKIGYHGDWTVDQARARARELVVMMDRGLDPEEERRKAEARGVTLAAALAEHVERLRAKGGSQRTIKDLLHDLPFYLPDWMERPLAGLTKTECKDCHRRLTEERGPVLANRIFRAVRALFNTALKTTDLERVNPCVAVGWNREERVQRPLQWEALPAWRATVETLGPVRRDYLLALLFTGLRGGDAAAIRWAEVDLDRALLTRPNPKGGKDRAFTIPIAGAVVEVLRRRRAENEILFGGDCPLVFPTRREADGALVPLVEHRWSRRGEDGKRPSGQSAHRLRDTFVSACHECGVPVIDIKTLVNHRKPGGPDVTLGYINQSLEYLRAHVERVAGFLTAKMTGGDAGGGGLRKN